MTIVITILAYFAILITFGRVTAGRAQGNEAFFRGDRRSPWYMVAFGMVGASISGVTFVSVPGMVLVSDMAYLQTCIGFIFGYLVVAFLLLPVYYKLNLTSIYTYLGDRLGKRSYKTGAAFFIISKLTGSAVKFHIVCMILQRFVLDAVGIPFPVTVVSLVALIWLYTRHGGIKTLVWTDVFQTACLFLALLLIVVQVSQRLGMSAGEAAAAVAHSDMSRVFVFDDWMSRQYFWKQFFSGIFIVIVMTGLDQGMMQKHLTCKSLREAQKDVCTYGFAFVPANLLFLSLGVLLVMLVQKEGGALPVGDELLPMYAATGRLGKAVVVFFTIGIVAASFCNADSSLTALTTSCCVDMFSNEHDEGLRRRVHLALCAMFVVIILLFKAVNSTSVIDAIYILCSYTYGPLLGLFAFGLFTKRQPNDKYVPYIAVLSPIICFVIDSLAQHAYGYKFGYELLMLNGIITLLGLYVFSKMSQAKSS